MNSAHVARTIALAMVLSLPAADAAADALSDFYKDTSKDVVDLAIRASKSNEPIATVSPPASK